MASNEVAVCMGENLTLMCTTSETLLTWHVSIPNRHLVDTRYIGSSDVGNNQPSVTIDQTRIQFIRTSVSPLTSIVPIENLTARFNGTMVECLDSERILLTTIHVIKNGIYLYSSSYCTFGGLAVYAYIVQLPN